MSSTISTISWGGNVRNPTVKEKGEKQNRRVGPPNGRAFALHGRGVMRRERKREKKKTGGTGNLNRDGTAKASQVNLGGVERAFDLKWVPPVFKRKRLSTGGKKREGDENGHRNEPLASTGGRKDPSPSKREKKKKRRKGRVSSARSRKTDTCRLQE